MTSVKPQPASFAVIHETSEGSAAGRKTALAYDELLRAYNALTEENQKRTVALASAAHELKTPLAIMAGYLDLLLSNRLGPLGEKQSQVLSAMKVSSERLQRFIQDFLTYSALETGNVSVELTEGNLNACLAETYDIWFTRFQAKGVALYFPVSEALPPFRFDYHKVQRVISNLLENAHLSTPSGGSVWLTGELYRWERRTRETEVKREQRRHRTDKPNSVRITVSDTGPGIAPEFHQEIFEDFVSLRPAAPDGSHGTGLGLAIARRLVAAQQGKIWVESESGSGCRFSFLLPLTPCL
ncbi:MAG TPA: HAMP domain-containing sensor histidine kinase [Terriglobales bacterium]|nr:HAMP domain-containing sensor histidine kinase [Terriglobales bacterium]